MKFSIDFIQTNGLSLFRSFRWGSAVYCPYCNSFHVYTCKDRYKCAHCGRRFTDKTGTLFHASNIPIPTLMMAIYLMFTNRGISSYILSEQLGLTQKSTWILQTKIRYALKQKDKIFADVICDEAYIGGRVSNMHRKRKYELCKRYHIMNPNEEYKKPFSKQLANAHTKTVMGFMDNSKEIILKYVSEPLNGQKTLSIIKSIDEGITHLTTDESALYFNCPYPHTILNHSKHIYKVDEYTTNPMENVFGWYKGQTDHNHRHIDRKYIQGYLNEFAFRRNNKGIQERIKQAFILFIKTTITVKKLTA